MSCTVWCSFVGLFIIIYLLFSGFLITKNKVPHWWIWAYYISPLQWGVTALVTNEFLSGEYNEVCTRQPIVEIFCYGLAEWAMNLTTSSPSSITTNDQWSPGLRKSVQHAPRDQIISIDPSVWTIATNVLHSAIFWEQPFCLFVLSFLTALFLTFWRFTFRRFTSMPRSLSGTSDNWRRLCRHNCLPVLQ